MGEEFTDDMKRQALLHRDEYIDFIINNHRYVDKKLDIQDVREDIKWVYEQCNQPPPKFILFASSYMQEKLMINFITNGGLEAMLEKGGGDGGGVTTTEKFIDKLVCKMRGGGGGGGVGGEMPVVAVDMANNNSCPEAIGTTTNIWRDVAQELWNQVKINQGSALRSISSKPMNSTLISRQILATVAKELGARNVSPFMWSEVWDSNRTFINDRLGSNVKNPIEEETRKRIGSVSNSINTRKEDDPIAVTASLLEFKKNSLSSAVFIEQNYGLLHDTWLSFYSYFDKIGMVDNKRFNRYYSLLRKGIFSMQFFEDWCIITQLPRRILRDTQGRLHSTDGPAVEWRSRPQQSSVILREEGQGQPRLPYEPTSATTQQHHPLTRNYYIHGIPFDQKMWEDIVTGTIPLKEVISISNMEKRQVILSVIPPRKLINECGGRVVSTHIQGKVGKAYMSKEDYEKIQHREIKLYKIDDVGKLGMRNDSVYILVYTDPSTDREYFMFVRPRDAEDAATAMASTLGLTKNQYLNLTAES